MPHRRFPCRLGLVPVIVLVAVTGGGLAASASTNTGYDISYPQCNGPFPSGGGFGIVGVNIGLPYSANPCLGTGNGPSELSWAGMNAQLYANTADPGPQLSSHWPNGQTTPQPCNTPNNPGSDSSQCHFDYGYNAAKDSYNDAVSAYLSLGWAPAGSTDTPVRNQWWLDVETANSWTSNTSLNVQALQGEAYLFTGEPVVIKGSTTTRAASLGFYSTSSDWATITGSTTAFSSSPTWLAGATSLSDAQSKCGGPGFTGGGVALVQFPLNGFDGDAQCSVQPALVFATSPQTLTAGSPSAGMQVALPQPAGQPVAVSVTSSSTSGRFDLAATGSFTATSATVTIPAGSTTSPAFYYEDAKAGAPTLTAAASGYASTTQSETVKAGPLASIAVSPASAQVRVGSQQSYSAVGADRFGNAVAVTPQWWVSPAVGTFSPNVGSPTTFSATNTGSGTITASANPVSGTASVTVVQKKHH